MILTLLGLTLAETATDAAEPAETATFTMEVDLGRDLGQSFGSLFEARDANGRVVAGAGFQDVYNTHFRNDRHTLQFFVRPQTGGDQVTVERLPHPDLDCGVYLFDMNEQVYAWTSLGNTVRRWDEGANTWVTESPPHATVIRSGDGVMRLGKGQLTFADDTAIYDDRVILSPPDKGGYHDFYYAQGHLCFYHRLTGDGGFTHLYACRWTPEDPGPVDLSRAIVFDTPYDHETPFAWGQWESQVLTVSNMGGIYVFENGRWRTILEPDDKTSYQVYSILHWHDRLLLAQYPTGNLFEYQGDEAKQIADWPPRLPGVSPSARECQTLSIYSGDLFAGVWPWAELWQRNRDAHRWISRGRMFTHPPTTDRMVHPYETQANQQGLVLNHWGQRITSMIPYRDSLLLSTSAKGTVKWESEYDFLSEEQRREYGAVMRLRMPGNLAAQVAWQDRPIRLTFTVSPQEITIEQDDRVLATSSFPEDVSADLAGISITWGNGVFGPLRGKILSQSSTSP